MIYKVLNYYRKRFWNPEKYARFIGVKIGTGCKIATLNFGSEPYLITIGNNVQITSDVKFSTHGAAWVFRKKYPNFDVFGKITVGDNVYIGNNVMIMPGVSIGNNVIIGAGAIVTKSVPDNLIIGGNPAKIIGNIDDLEQKLLPFNVDSKKMNSKEKKLFLLSLPDERFIKKE